MAFIDGPRVWGVTGAVGRRSCGIDGGLHIFTTPTHRLNSLPEHEEMISNGMAERLNSQINMEFYSAYFYMSMSAHSETANLRGIAAWFMAKYEEEMTHAMKLYRYLHDQGARVVLEAVAKPPAEYAGVLDMFEKTLAHEQEVTAAFNDLVEAALAERDHATNIFLQWFVTEQIEEEATVSDIIGRVKLVGERGEGLYMIDNELAGAARQLAQAPAGGAQ